MHLNVYAGTKVEMENLAKEYEKSGGSVIGLRYFNVYGPNEQHKIHMASMIWQLALQMAAARKPRIFQWGEQERDQIYVEDVVKANLLAAKSDANGIFNIGTGKSISFNQIIHQLGKSLNRIASTEYFENPYWSYQSRTLADTKLAETVLQFSAEYDFASGIEEYFRQVDVHKYIDVVAAKGR
jgi:ADP-L-glycero-D-manno-heptose 6-epimerase